MSFEAFKAGEEEQYLFFRFPWTLLRDKRYKWKISMNSRILYGCMLDRQRLSRKNGWIDENGEVFIYYTLDEICYDVEVSSKTASVLLNELEGVGLIRRVRQGLCKPNRLYVGKFFKPEPYRECIRTSNHYASGNVEDTAADPLNLQGIKNNSIKTEDIKINPIYPYDGMDVDNSLADYFEEQCSFEILKHDYPHRESYLDSIRELMIEICTSKASTIRINSEDRPAETVKSRFMKLNMEHIRYVCDCLMQNTTKISNIRAYLLTALFNAPVTIDHYYTALVNHDMAHPNEGGK